MNKYVLYVRVSTKEQGKSGLGLAAQERDIGLFLTHYSDKPYEIVKRFTEIASGADSNRKELTKAVNLAKKLGATLLVAKLDRLGRKVAQVATLLDDKKLKVIVASMPNADKFQLHIYAALAEQEREFISIRTKQALAEAKAKGVKLGGLRDKTKARNKAKKKVADEFAKRLEPIVQPMLDSDLTLVDIAARLNDTGIATAYGGRWYPTTVKNLRERLVWLAGDNHLQGDLL